MVVSDNYMDRWILSFTQSLIKFVTKEMAGEYFVGWTSQLVCCYLVGGLHSHLIVCVCDYMLIKFVTKKDGWWVLCRLDFTASPLSCWRTSQSFGSVCLWYADQVCHQRDGWWVLCRLDFTAGLLLSCWRTSQSFGSVCVWYSGVLVCVEKCIALALMCLYSAVL